MNRRLYRCRHDRRLAGVSAGLAEYFEIDPTIVRLLWVVSVFLTGGLSILVYIAMALIVPPEPLGDVEATQTHALGVDGQGHRAHGEGSGRWVTFFGLALMFLGGLALLDTLMPSWVDSWRYLGPVFFLGLGALLVVGAVRRERTESGESMGSMQSPET